MKREFVFSGFGGQGIMTMGTLLATAGMREGMDVTWLPSYGAEQRGGTANCTVVVSDRPIASPIVDRPGFLVAMNLPSLRKFEPRVAPGGTVFVNSSLIEAAVERKDVEEVRLPVNALAQEIGSPRVANVVMLGALVASTGTVRRETLLSIFEEMTTGRKANLAALNIAAFTAGVRAVLG